MYIDINALSGILFLLIILSSIMVLFQHDKIDELECQLRDAKSSIDLWRGEYKFYKKKSDLLMKEFVKDKHKDDES